MAARTIKERYQAILPKGNSFYCDHYHQLFWVLMVLIILTIVGGGVVYYQAMHRPLPVFTATEPKGQTMSLTPYDEPNLLPDTILQWASKAATVAYTFDFVNYNKQLALARPYFTTAGWQDYLRSVVSLINTIIQNMLFVNGVVSGTPVIANQGPLPGKGYTWRVQIPFLVTYQSANTSYQRTFYVVLTIVRVPTEINPQGIGIEQFVMTTMTR